MEHVRTILENEYGLTIYECRAVGGQIFVQSEQGCFYLFGCPVAYQTKQRLINRIKKHLAAQSSWKWLPHEKTRSGTIFALYDDECYYLLPAIREAIPRDYPFAVGQALAQFHQATAGLNVERFVSSHRTLGQWPTVWKKKLKTYDSFRDSLEVQGGEITPFDEYLLMTYTYVHQLGKTAIKYLRDCDYAQVVKESAKLGKVAYHNFDNGYLLFNEDGSRYVTGEYGWVLDMRSRDIGQWIKAEVRRNGWNPQVTQSFLAGYNTVSPLLDREYEVIYALLLYPGRFLRFVDVYSRLDEKGRMGVPHFEWQSQMDEELLAMEEALYGYPNLVEQAFGVCVKRLDWLWKTADDDTISVPMLPV